MDQVPYRITSLEEVRNAIDSSTHVAIDFETEGFYGKILLAQFFQRHWPEVLIVQCPEVLELATTLKPLHIVAHQANYEVSTLQNQLGIVFSQATKKWLPSDFEDTLLLAKLQFWKREKFSLDMCYQYMLGFCPYEAQELNKAELQKSDFTIPSKSQLTYAATDVFYLLDLFDACSEWHDKQCYQLDKLATNHAFSFQTNGLAIDVPRIQQRVKENLASIAVLDVPINVNSWQQVRPYIGEAESDGYHLAYFSVKNGNKRAAAVQKARKLLKENSFLKKYLVESVAGRVYGKFSFTTKSGRGNCCRQNLQQLPRSTKSMFCAEPGNTLVMSDFAQLELRYIAAIANDTRMTQMFKSKADLHEFTGTSMDVKRQYAKTCNFNLTYGGSAKMLQSIFLTTSAVWLELPAVTKLKQKWHGLWTGITAWQQKAVQDWQDKKPFCTLLGRKMAAKLYTDAMNLPIQGGSADVAKLALHKMLTSVAKEESLKGVKFVNFVHDSFMWECEDRPAVYELLSAITARAMQDAWNELISFTPVPDMPMPVDVQVGYNWGDIESGAETPTYTLNLEG